MPRELAEAALAHVTGGVEGAYYRSDVIDLRRDLMQRWADHCLPAAGLGANVVQMVERAAGDGRREHESPAAAALVREGSSVDLTPMVLSCCVREIVHRGRYVAVPERPSGRERLPLVLPVL